MTKVKETLKKSIALNSNISPENKILKETIDNMKTFFDGICNDASFSSMMLDHNIHDSFSKLVSDSINDPLKSSFTALSSIEDSIVTLLNAYVCDFLLKNKKHIKAAYKQKKSGTILHYTILFKDDSLKTKYIFFSFLNNYERTPYNTRFPLIFLDIPIEIQKDFKPEMIINGFDQVI